MTGRHVRPWRRSGHRVAAARFQLAGGRVFTPTEALLTTAASAVIPGFAHARAGHRDTGRALFAGCAALALAVAAAPAGLPMPRAARQTLIAYGPATVAAVWVVLLLLSYVAVRPRGARPAVRLAAGAAVALLCALAAVVPLQAGHPGRVAHEAARGRVPMAAPPAAVPPAAPRLNVLLVAAAGPRVGRMTLASVATRTGDTVLLLLPGGLRHRPVRGLPARTRLDTVYAYGLAHPRLAARGAANPGAALLKRTVGRAIGLPVDFYRVLDARRLRRIVAAAHGCAAAPRLLPSGAGAVPGSARTAGARTVLTDIPRRLPPSLAALSLRERGAAIRTVRVVPATGVRRPDSRLRAAAGRAIDGAFGHAPHHGSRVAGDLCR